MSAPKLDNRLLAVLGLIVPGGVVADIGTDHGFLACALIERGVASYVYACDKNPLPLKKAEVLVKSRSLEQKVAVVLTDGLAGLPVDQIDTYVLAGMGGELIGEIITASAPVRSPQHFILQPMSKPERLRETLYKNGFAIGREIAVESGAKLYTVMAASRAGKPQAWGPLEIWAGKLLEEKTAEAKRYLEITAARIDKMSAGLASINLPKARQYARLAAEIRERAK